MLKGHADIRHIQELLGHRTLSATQVYTHVAVDDLKKVHARCHPRERKKR
jgi:site-specific recombinase XerD